MRGSIVNTLVNTPEDGSVTKMPTTLSSSMMFLTKARTNQVSSGASRVACAFQTSQESIASIGSRLNMRPYISSCQ